MIRTPLNTSHLRELTEDEVEELYNDLCESVRRMYEAGRKTADESRAQTTSALGERGKNES